MFLRALKKINFVCFKTVKKDKMDNSYFGPMSDNKTSSNNHAGSRERRKRKRQAFSPFSDNGLPSVSSVSNKGERPNNN